MHLTVWMIAVPILGRLRAASSASCGVTRLLPLGQLRRCARAWTSGRAGTQRIGGVGAFLFEPQTDAAPYVLGFIVRIQGRLFCDLPVASSQDPRAFQLPTED